ncbi:predicted protein [Sparassis crispa]|uniref:Methyltransferase type 11 domain-containing protein n=1 Tax=Sparassis crispa TaxID=139825 RepID=A0A401G9Y8_9APHY|nr:predicted protein [Sparassis crispa]GBE78994.1 predicted protein [Sparassis crispa]
MQLPVRRGRRVLEIGCGTGGRARELAHFSDVDVVGVDADASNIELARICTENAQLSHCVSFIQASMETLCAVFEDNSFDAVFSVESITSSGHFDAACSQVRRILKPGGKFAFYRWCMSDAWDAGRMDHRQVWQQLGQAILSHGQPLQVQSIDNTTAALGLAGFSLCHSEDLAKRVDDVPWYHTLEELEHGRPIEAVSWAWWNEGPNAEPAEHAQDRNRSLYFAVRTILKAGRLGLLTPMALFVVQKNSDAQTLSRAAVSSGCE